MTVEKLKFGWVSKRLYHIGKRVGNVVHLTRPDKYMLLDTNKRAFSIDQGVAKQCKDAEKNINDITGRPSLFPGEKISVKLITLPDRLWGKIGRSASVNIAKVFDK